TAHPARRSYRCARLARFRIDPARSERSAVRVSPVVLRNRFSHRSPPLARAAPCGPACRSASAAVSPTAPTPLEACTPVACFAETCGGWHYRAALPIPDTPPISFLPPCLPAPALLFPALPDIPTAALLSRLTPRGIRESSPAGRCVLETRSCRP